MSDRVYVYMSVDMSMHMSVHMSTHTSVHIFVHMSTHMSIYTCLSAGRHTYLHVYTHVHTRPRRLAAACDRVTRTDMPQLVAPSHDPLSVLAPWYEPPRILDLNTKIEPESFA